MVKPAKTEAGKKDKQRKSWSGRGGQERKQNFGRAVLRVSGVRMFDAVVLLYYNYAVLYYTQYGFILYTR